MRKLMEGQLERNVVVTGSGRGIGRAVAVGLAALGWRVLALDVGCGPDGCGTDSGPVEDTAIEITNRGGTALAEAVDVQSAVEVDAAIARAVALWGPLDAAVNVAGVLRMGDILSTSDEDWHVLNSVNVGGAVHVCRSVIRRWPEGPVPAGRILNFTSAAGLEGHPDMLAYSASKAALIGLTRSMANSLAARHATANAIAPIAATRMAVRGLGATGTSTALESEAKTLLAPMDIDAEAVVPLVAYLLSTAGAALTGQVFTNRGWRYSLLGESRVVGTTQAQDRHLEAAIHDIDEAFSSLRVDTPRWSTAQAGEMGR